jgi:hypothetical protein
MRSARLLGAVAVTLLAIGLGGWLTPVVHAESGPPIMETGWWSRRPLAQPVADEGFAIGWALEQEQSAAAVRIDLSGDLSGTVYLELHEVGGSAPDQGLARVCITTDTWKAANPGPYAELPEATCAPGESADLGRDGEALTWLGDITALVAAADGDTLSLVVRPVGKPLTDGVPTGTPFEVQFDSATLLVDPGSSGSSPVPEGESSFFSDPSFTAGGGSFDDPYVPDLGSGFDVSGLPPVEGPASGPTGSPTDEPVGPEELVALGPVDVTSAGGRPWVRLVVLVPLSAGLGFAMAAARRWQLERAIPLGLA